MGHRDVGLNVQEEKSSHAVVLFLQKIESLQAKFKMIASGNEVFQTALYNVFEGEVEATSLTIRDVLKKFDQYHSVEQINGDFDLLCKPTSGKWQGECKELNHAGLRDGGRLLIELYRRYVIHAFVLKANLKQSKNQFISPAVVKNQADTPALSFLARMKVVLKFLKSAAIDTDDAAQQFINKPFRLKTEFEPPKKFKMDFRQLLVDVPKLNLDIQEHRHAVEEASRYTIGSVDSVSSLHTEQARQARLDRLADKLLQEEEELSNKKKRLQESIGFSLPYYLEALVHDEKEHAATIDKLSFTVNEDTLKNEFKCSEEGVRIQKSIQSAEVRLAERQQQFEWEQSRIADILQRRKTIIALRGQLIALSADFNDREHGTEASEIFQEIYSAIDSLLMQPENTIIDSEAEATIEKGKNEISKLYDEINALHAQLNKVEYLYFSIKPLLAEAVIQFRDEILARRDTLHQAHMSATNDFFQLAIVEVIGTNKLKKEVVPKLRANCHRIKEELGAKQFEVLQDEFKKIEILSTIGVENLGIKQERLTVFRKKVIDLCESWGGLVEKYSHLTPANLVKYRQFYRNVNRCLEEVMRLNNMEAILHNPLMDAAEEVNESKNSEAKMSRDTTGMIYSEFLEGGPLLEVLKNPTQSTEKLSVVAASISLPVPISEVLQPVDNRYFFTRYAAASLEGMTSLVNRWRRF